MEKLLTKQVATAVGANAVISVVGSVAKVVVGNVVAIVTVNHPRQKLPTAPLKNRLKCNKPSKTSVSALNANYNESNKADASARSVKRCLGT